MSQKEMLSLAAHWVYLTFTRFKVRVTVTEVDNLIVAATTTGSTTNPTATTISTTTTTSS